MASYYEDKEKHDKIYFIVEIGSPQIKEAALDMAKKSIQIQLNEYMVLLGSEGERWATNVLGVAILGTEVCANNTFAFSLFSISPSSRRINLLFLAVQGISGRDPFL